MKFDWQFFYTTLCIVLGMGASFMGFKRLLSFLKLGRPDPLKGNTDERVKLFYRNVLGQAKLFKDFWPGLQHFIIFWGFIIITLGTMEAIVQGFFHSFTLSFLGPIYHGLVLTQDSLHLLVLLAVIYGFFRRFITKPKRLDVPWEHAMTRSGTSWASAPKSMSQTRWEISWLA